MNFSHLIRIAATASALMAASVSAHASGLAQFKSFVAETKSARGDFTQRQVQVTGGAQKAASESVGNFVFSRPGRFIWTYQKPFEQLLQSDGDLLYIYDKDLNQVIVRKLGDAIGASPAAILFGSSDLEKNFSLKDAGTGEGYAWVEATPLAQDASFERIAIGMKDGLPMAMELKDSFGQTSRLQFTNVVKNPALNSDSFRFTPPKGADVLQQ